MGKCCIPDEHFEKKTNFLTTPPLENGLEIFEKPNCLVTVDGFHGRESISVDFRMTYILCNGRTKC